MCVVLWNWSFQNISVAWLPKLEENSQLAHLVSISDTKGRSTFIQLKEMNLSEACPPLCGVITPNITCFLEGNHDYDDDDYDNKVIAHYFFGQLVFKDT